MSRRIFLLLRVLRHLGFKSIVTVFIYRLLIRLGFFEKLLKIGEAKAPVNIFKTAKFSKDLPISRDYIELLNGKITYFSKHVFSLNSPPNWFLNPFSGKSKENRNRHWSRIGDFDGELGDIKGVWELSRFTWALILARGYIKTGNSICVELLNSWVLDWEKRNPLNVGINWKCGQEVSIRMMHLLLTAYILGQDKKPSPDLKQLVIEHCSRISPTTSYAISQKNIHGISEAGGLYIAGAWLSVNCGYKNALRWHRKGRDCLEKLVKKLIAPDGSFSMYSINYHREVLDVLNIVEWWRRQLELPLFSETFYSRVKAAVEYLYQMVDLTSGDAPNIGANDGTLLFPLSSTDFRNYKPTVELGSVLFLGEKAYKKGVWDEPLMWLDLGSDYELRKTLKKKSCIFEDGGHVVLHSKPSGEGSSWAVIRFPVFKFRPSHADIFHVDLWHNGVNVLRDGGSYSYNTDNDLEEYFPGTVSHNTIEFDNRNQMPRISRFLFGDWLKADSVGKVIENGNSVSWSGSYTDFCGCKHKRTLEVKGNIWRITDEIEGFKDKAILRWRLMPGKWEIKDRKCCGEIARLSVECSVEIQRFELLSGLESRYYMEKSRIPVLEVEINEGRGIFVTEVQLTVKP